MVMCVLPLALIGVVAALLLFNQPLGFVAILGILALIGMIAKNAVILITQIEDDRAEGQGVWGAVVVASSSRLRPMTLTAISTVLGLIPIAPTVFWGPMAFAIMGGLLVATMLTLVFLPTAYVTWFKGWSRSPPRRRLGCWSPCSEHTVRRDAQSMRSAATTQLNRSAVPDNKPVKFVAELPDRNPLRPLTWRQGLTSANSASKMPLKSHEHD